MGRIMPKFRVTVKNGVLTIHDQESYNTHLTTLPEECQLSISPYKKHNPRSNQQNKYYWGCVLPLISDDTGYEVEECHEICKTKFLSEELLVGFENVRVITKSTTSLTTAEMEEFLSEVRQWASKELSVYIPLPNETEDYS